MEVIRRRLDLIGSLRQLGADPFSTAETAAFHGRKIVEGIAFGCLAATEQGLKHVPRDAKGQWSAEKILRSLEQKNISVFPSPSVIRKATSAERKEMNVKAVVEGIAEKRIPHDDLVQIYQSLHRWLHEINPYVETDRMSFCTKYGPSLWSDLSRLEDFIERHFISIAGQGFFCTLRDSQDGQTKVLPLSKVQSL